MRRPCAEVGCPNVVERGRRCKPCERAYQGRRNADPKRRAYDDPAYRSIPLGGLCWLCGEPGADTRDHVIPLSRGGSNHPSNIRPAHRRCNSSRGGSRAPPP